MKAAKKQGKRKPIRIPPIYLSIISGLLYSLSYAPFNNIFACAISIILLFYINIESKTFKSIVTNNMIFASFYAFVSFTWMGNALLYFDEYSFLAFFTPIFTAAYQSFWFILLGILFWICRFILNKISCDDKKSLLILPFIFAILWTLVEFLRSVTIFAFPWNLVGTVLIDFPLCVRIIKLYSLYFLGGIFVFLCAFSYSLLYLLFTRDYKRFLTAGLLLSILMAVFSVNLYHHAEHYSNVNCQPSNKIKQIGFRMINPTVDQKQKWLRSELETNLMKNIQLSFSAPSENITFYVWPETAFAFIVESNHLGKCNTNKNKYIEYTVSFLKEGQYLITGGMRRDENKQLFNSIFLINHKGEIVDHYDKIHLVPFGEFVPFAEILKHVGMNNVGGLTSAKIHNKGHHLSSGGVHFHPLICFEGIFPCDTSSKRECATTKPIVLNLSNDAYFKNSFAPEQHLRLVRARAIELNRPLLRSSNGGITALIDENGKIVKMLSKNTHGFIDVFI